MADLEDLGAAAAPDRWAGVGQGPIGGGGGGRNLAPTTTATAPPPPPPSGTVRPVKIIRRARMTAGAAPAPPSSTVDAQPPIPGTGRVWLKTFGCAHNHADGETMAGVLAAQGYNVLMADAECGGGGEGGEDASADGADCWVINSCTVKTPSQTSVGRLVRAAGARGIPVVVTGCVPSGDKAAPELAGASLIGTAHTGRVAEVVAHALAGNTVHILGRGPLPGLDLPRIRRNAHIEIVPLSTGCLGRCTYCKTVHARGSLGSHPPAAIVERVAAAGADPAVREVWLSSEDTGAYGRDIGASLPALLAACLAALPADGRTLLRVGMTNPPYVLDRPGDLDSLSDAVALPSFSSSSAKPAFSFLHVPVQSGSDAVLGAMRREYTAAQFEEVAAAAAAKGVTLATDIIVGFPGETESDHAATLALLTRWRFRAVHISRFHARPGTPAAAMPQLPRSVVAARSREVAALVDSWTDAWTHHVGTTQRAWAVGVAADGAHTVAHTRDYCQVLLDPGEASPGDVVEVEVVSAGRWSVKGRVVEVVFRPPSKAVVGTTTTTTTSLAPATPSPVKAGRAVTGGAEAASPAGAAAARPPPATLPPGLVVVALLLAALAAGVARLMGGVWRSAPLAVPA